MIGDTWEDWNHKQPPAGIIIKAYGYYDPIGTTFVGTSDEVYYKIRGLGNGYCQNMMWRLTGIGKQQLENRPQPQFKYISTVKFGSDV